MPATTGRSRGRQGARARARGAAGEHLPKIITSLITATVVIAFALVMTKPGRDIDAATQRFMLFYAGVFALVGLTAAVGVGLLATDRIIMTPAHRVMAQAVHRAVSFGALAFLVIHIVTEILAQRVHVIDAFIPFLSPYRTFYIGLGTIASDLILLVVVSSIVRKRYSAHGKAWRWRAIHYASYVAFVFGVLHGLLGGRAAKPYVDWSYGFAIALTALALAVRFLVISLRPKESLSAAPGTDRGYPAASPLRAAALSLTQAQLGGTVQVLPAAMAAQGTGLGLSAGQAWAAVPPPGWSPSSGPFPALPPVSCYTGEARDGPEFVPLGAPAYPDGTMAGAGPYPYAPVGPPRPALTRLGAGGHWGRQPRYEPGYDGPPRFEGAPRDHVPQDEVSSYPYGPQSRRPQPGTGYGQYRGDSRPQASRVAGSSGPRTYVPGRAPQPGQPDWRTGPTPRLAGGPAPRGPATGPLPRAGSGPMPRLGAGPPPRANAGPAPRRTGPDLHAAAETPPRADSGSVSRTGPMHRADSPSGQRTDHRRGAAARPSRRANPAEPRYRDHPGQAGGNECG